jgi:HNH endonuclease
MNKTLPVPQLTEAELERLIWCNVERGDPDACWPWQRGLGGKNRTAYGYAVKAIARRQYRVSRVIYRALIGEIPDEHIIMHTCDFPPCCNPAHLRLGTASDNMKDRTAKGRHPVETMRQNGKINILRAHAACKARNFARSDRQIANDTARRILSGEQIAEIRLRCAAGELQKHLAAEFGVSKQLVNTVVLRKGGYR